MPKMRTARICAPFIVWQVGCDQRIYYLKGSVTEIREINKCQLINSVIENSTLRIVNAYNNRNVAL
jgi:hypothetical protein